MNSEMLKIVLGLVAVFVILMVLNTTVQVTKTKYDTELALLSSGNDSEMVQGIFIRNEEVKRYSGSGVLCYEVADGGKVSVGSVIASVYGSDSQIAVLDQIEKCEKELALLGRITNPGTLKTAQPANISQLFDESCRDYLYDRERGDISDLAQNRDNMLVWLSTYQLLTGTSADYKGKIASLTSQLESLRLTQEAPSSVITSDKTAYFVSYADGYEDKLTLENAGNLTAEDLSDVSDGPLDDSDIVGKLIKGYQWGIACVVDNTSKRYQKGDRVTLKFASTAQTVPGEIVSMNTQDGEEKTVLLISCEELTYALVQHRTEKVEIIKDSYSGIQVPRSALRFMDMTVETEDPETGEVSETIINCRGVYVLEGEQPAFRRVSVCYEGTDYVVSDICQDSSYLQLYDSIITKGIDANGE